MTAIESLAPGERCCRHADGPAARCAGSGRRARRLARSGGIDAALSDIGVQPGVEWSASSASAEILYVHRRTDGADIYFVDNRRVRVETVDMHFRSSGRKPEPWRADTGQSEPMSYCIQDGETVVPLTLGADESLFVIFRSPALAPSASVATPVTRVLGDITGPWEVGFQARRGAPATAVLDVLQSRSDNREPGILYFSGIASYRNRFIVAARAPSRGRLELDLSSVADVAEVRVNGQSAGIAWKKPYRVDITALVRPGCNDLEIEVANLWVDRLIGDAQPGAEKIAFTALPTYRSDAPLRPAGLLGPVRLIEGARP
jgi:hypothetical protein